MTPAQEICQGCQGSGRCRACGGTGRCPLCQGKKKPSAWGAPVTKGIVELVTVGENARSVNLGLWG